MPLRDFLVLSLLLLFYLYLIIVITVLLSKPDPFGKVFCQCCNPLHLQARSNQPNDIIN